MRRRVEILLFLLLLGAAGLSAQTFYKSEQKSLMGIEVHFRFDKHFLDLGYMGNEASLQRFSAVIDSLGLERVDSVVIVSQSSPEGVYEHNQWLSRNRANTMRRHLEKVHPELKSKLFVHPDGESWLRLREYVKRDTLMKNSTIQKVLSVIDADVNIGTKKWRMEQLPVYRYLLRTYYPRIRNSMFCILYYNELPVPALAEPAEPQLENNQALYMQPTYPVPAPKRMERTVKDKVTILALKTNLLYDLATALNVEVEVPIGQKWSVMVEDVFPWWHKGNKYAFQMWEMGVEGRYWFKRNFARKVLCGHFGGVYVMSAKYDFQWDTSLNYQGEYWSTGVTYGYAMPIGKWFNLEFSASLGYLSTAYRHYRPSTHYEELLKDNNKQGRMGYFGPTKLKVSLVLPINVPVKKRKEVYYE
ncbi:MAG: DUF3575 domain-containing protein [Bacteroides sp.]|nr:DUF3575 domain-containing protein [Bacteroides sp.]